MNVETVAAILFVLAIAALALLVLSLADRVRALEKDLKYERDARYEAQSKHYDLAAQLRDGFVELGLRWEPKKDGGWTK